MVPVLEPFVETPPATFQVDGPFAGFQLTVVTQGDLTPNDIDVRIADEWMPDAMADVLASPVVELHSPDVYKAIASAELTLPFDTTRFTPEEAAGLRIWTVDPDIQMWLPVEGPQTVDVATGTVTAHLEHFSPYAVMVPNPDWVAVLSAPSQVCSDPFNPTGVDVVLAIDSSGSMNSEYLIGGQRIDFAERNQLASDAARSIVAELSTVDQVAVISWGSDAQTLLEPTSSTDIAVEAAIAAAETPTSGSDLTSVLDLAAGLRSPDRMQILVVISDGEITISSEDAERFLDEGGRLEFVAVTPGAEPSADLTQLATTNLNFWDFRGAAPGAAEVLAAEIRAIEYLDTDSDGLSDCVETNGALVPLNQFRSPFTAIVVYTDPTMYSSDSDVLADGAELRAFNLASHPTAAAIYSEVVANGNTFAFSAFSDPLFADTDGDGDDDGMESTFNSDPRDVVLATWQLQNRARYMPDLDAVSILLRDFDVVAPAVRDPNSIVEQELIAAVAGRRLPNDLRIAAMKILYNDGLTGGEQPRYLFSELDVASSTDVDEAMFRQSFAFGGIDGKISQSDLEVYPRKRWELTTIAPWVSLIDTARDGYDVTKADGYNPNKDWIAFILDDAIPDEARIAAASIKSWATVEFDASGQPTRWSELTPVEDQDDNLVFSDVMVDASRPPPSETTIFEVDDSGILELLNYSKIYGAPAVETARRLPRLVPPPEVATRATRAGPIGIAVGVALFGAGFVIPRAMAPDASEEMVILRDNGETVVIPYDERIIETLPQFIDSVQQEIQQLDTLSDIALTQPERDAIDELTARPTTNNEEERDRRQKARNCVVTIAEIVAEFGPAAIAALVPGTNGAFSPTGNHLCLDLDIYYPGSDVGGAGEFRERAVDAYPLWTFEYRVTRHKPVVTFEGGFDYGQWYNGVAWPAGPTTPPGPYFGGAPPAVITYTAGCTNRPTVGVSLDCDEFPNASMGQGAQLRIPLVNDSVVIPSPQPGLVWIERGENQDEGIYLNTRFYVPEQCDVRPRDPNLGPPANPLSWFLVIPVADELLRTDGHCASEGS